MPAINVVSNDQNTAVAKREHRLEGLNRQITAEGFLPGPQEAGRPPLLKPLPPVTATVRRSRTKSSTKKNAVAPEPLSSHPDLPPEIKQMLENQERMLTIMKETMQSHTVLAWFCYIPPPPPRMICIEMSV